MGLEVTRMMEERVEHGHEFINMIVTKKEKVEVTRNSQCGEMECSREMTVESRGPCCILPSLLP